MDNQPPNRTTFYTCKEDNHHSCRGTVDRRDGYWICDCECHKKDREKVYGHVIVDPIV